MSIQTFYQIAQAKEFARVFQFRLLSLGDVEDFGSHSVYVETAALPGRAITNVPVPYMGLSFNIPGTATYPGSAGYQVQFRCDQNYDIRSALEAATFATFDDETSTGDYRTPRSSSTMTIELLDNEMNAVRIYKMFGVYTQAIGDTQYDIKDGGTVQTIQATLAYQFWRSSNNEGAVISPGTLPPLVPTETYGPVNVPAWPYPSDLQ